MRKLLLLAAVLTACPAAAEPVEVREGWVRMVPGDAPSAAYLTLTNRGDAPVELVAAEAPHFDRIMLHETVESEGSSHMAHVESITVGPGDSRRLAPGGYHLMLMEPQDPPAVGETLAVTLRFADGSTVEADLTVEPPYSQGPQ